MSILYILYIPQIVVVGVEQFSNGSMEIEVRQARRVGEEIHQEDGRTWRTLSQPEVYGEVYVQQGTSHRWYDWVW